MINQENIKNWLDTFIDTYLDKYCPAEGWYDKVDGMVKDAKEEAQDFLLKNFEDVNMAYGLSDCGDEIEKGEIISIINKM